MDTETKLVDGPRYTHDCALCVYLGRYVEYDLYFADHGGAAPEYTPRTSTIIARYAVFVAGLASYLIGRCIYNGWR